jgi:hypothetical protein
MKKKIAQVREALGQRYQEGFDPLLREAEARYAEEAQASERLRQEIARKEQLLRNAEKEMRRLEEDVMSPQKESGASTQHSKEMDKLNMELRNLWVELKSDPDEVATQRARRDLAVQRRRAQAVRGRRGGAREDGVVRGPKA